MSWLFLGLSVYAFVQGAAIFPRDSEGPAPPSVALQKWALGEEKSDLLEERLILADLVIQDPLAPCDAVDLRGTTLSWSIEPLHTQGAIGALLLCALFTFAGATLFSDKKSQVILLVAMTAMGIAVACFGFLGAYSYRSENFLGLRTGSSFACFKSKNSAAAYLNICLAASLGLVAWTLINLQRKDSDLRYKVVDGTILSRVRGALEDFLSDLNTPQIAAVICAVVIGISVVISQCRGAVMAAVAAIVATAFIVGKKSSRGGNIIAPTLIVLAALAASAAFQLDENSYERLETLAEFDIEADSISGRIYIWSVAIDAMKYFGFLGSGLGTFHFAYLPFQHPTSPGWFYHAESLYLQIGVELGLIGLLLVFAWIGRIGIKLQSRVSSEAWKAVTPMRIAGAFLFFSQLVHSSVDFGLILPASFLPACLLLGSCLSGIDAAKESSMKKRDQRHLKDDEKSSKSKMKSPIIVLGFFLSLGGLGFLIKPSLEILAATEAIEYKFRNLSRLRPSEKQPGSLETLLDTWHLSAKDLNRSPDALRILAQSAIQDQRLEIIMASPSSDWDSTWKLTDPILLQLGLDREKSPDKQAEILRLAGGNKALETMKNASYWYSLAHSRSPLDWRLSWGRCRNTLTCSRENMLPLVSPVVQLGQHATNQLIESSLLFRAQLSDYQIDKIWQQAMKTKPSTAIQTARMMIAERDLESLDIAVFPQRSDILRSLATQVFTSSEFPEIHKRLWTRAREVLDKTKPRALRELWLADAARALGELEQEIQHLRVASNYEQNNNRLSHRLALRLLDIGDIDGAKAVLDRMRRMDADSSEVKDLTAKINNRRNKP
ncbi:O-antigen ligase family protein [Pirellulaceae bacterium SH449]